MAHHNSTPRSVLEAPSITVEYLVKHEPALIKNPLWRRWSWRQPKFIRSPFWRGEVYHRPEPKTRRGKKAARHARRFA